MIRLPVIGSSRPTEPEAVGLALAPPPEEVKIRLLQPCDLRCGMCWHWQDPEAQDKRLEAGVLAGVIEDLGALGTRKVKFTGGEPTLRRDLEDLVRLATSVGLEVTIATNAFSLTPRRADALVAAGVRIFHVSLDADDAEVHDRIRGIEGAFARTVGALRYLAGAHRKVKRKIATVIQRRNAEHLEGLVPLAAELGVPAIYLLMVQTEPWCAEDRPTPRQVAEFYLRALPAMLEAGLSRGVRVNVSPLFESLQGVSAKDQLRALREAAGDAGGPFTRELEAYAAEEYGRYFYRTHPCQEIVGRAEIAETGDVFPCCHTEVPELSMGNVRREPFSTVWNRVRYRRFRDPEGPLPRHPRCLTCKDAHYAP